jgi:regulator of sirC expression with transglutaminase-like and TPR domain
MTSLSLSLAEAKRQLARLGSLPDSAIDLAEAGLMLARFDHPTRDLDHYRTLLGEMAEALGALAGSAEHVSERITALTAVLIGRFGLIGDDRDDDRLDSANLMQVLDRRRGPANSLGLIWLHLGRGQGWPIEPLAFPGHCLLRLSDDTGQRVIIDPFWGGRRCDAVELRDLLKASAGLGAELEPAHYATQSNRDVLLRLQTSIKLRYLRHAELGLALQTVEMMLLFAPDQIALWREAGLMHLRQGNLRAAIAALEQFVTRAPNSAARHRTSVLLEDLRTRLT